MPTNYLVVTGSRTFDDDVYLFKLLDEAYARLGPDTVVLVGDNGGTPKTRGVDKLTEDWCWKRGVTRKKYHAEWDKYGKQAGVLRNEFMAKDGTHCLAVWDGKSPGTKDMIDRAERRGLRPKVFHFNQPEDEEFI